MKSPILNIVVSPKSSAEYIRAVTVQLLRRIGGKDCLNKLITVSWDWLYTDVVILKAG